MVGCCFPMFLLTRCLLAISIVDSRFVVCVYVCVCVCGERADFTCVPESVLLNAHI
jgi:hypothetical protein